MYHPFHIFYMPTTVTTDISCSFSGVSFSSFQVSAFLLCSNKFYCSIFGNSQRGEHINQDISILYRQISIIHYKFFSQLVLSSYIRLSFSLLPRLKCFFHGFSIRCPSAVTKIGPELLVGILKWKPGVF